jgi:secondary thiamine-phosphate synthase enzyme
MAYLRHTYEGPDDMPAHIKAALLPVSLQVPVAAGRMRLGTWQGIYLVEHRRAPHRRTVAALFQPTR